ncbi:MAG: ATP-binding cassette domain-containing protein [Lachnospiraceae bacterium]|nr:ATP-binding cassette domain-containing protein [Lachnospiraceae bacterium]
MDIKAEGIKREFIRKMKDSNVFEAVQKTDFVLRAGELTMLEGRSGGGKSTFMSMLCGLLKPTEGKVTAGGTDLYSLSDDELSKFRNLHFGIIPQVQTGISSLTVRENILLPYTLYNEELPDARWLDELLKTLDIGNLADSMLSELSGGELRRMTIARAMIRKPEILMADEPTGDLDDENTEMVLQLLQKAARAGSAVLLVTHENCAAGYADVRYTMSGGVLREV